MNLHSICSFHLDYTTTVTLYTCHEYWFKTVYYYLVASFSPALLTESIEMAGTISARLQNTTPAYLSQYKLL